jgi:outer membrane murein-binding lipoprotein Lpp
MEESMKNIGILSLVVVVTVLLTLAFSAAAAPKLATQPATIAVPVAPLATPLPEPHPEIRAALDAMHNAKDHLEHAAHDYEGHRVEAIKHLDAAIHEAEICDHMK